MMIVRAAIEVAMPTSGFTHRKNWLGNVYPTGGRLSAKKETTKMP